MMLRNVYAIYDKKGAYYGAPVFFAREGEFLRDVTKAIIAYPDSNFNQFPGDYDCYEIGSYEDSSGKLIPLAEPRFITSLIDLKSSVSNLDSSAVSARVQAQPEKGE